MLARLGWTPSRTIEAEAVAKKPALNDLNRWWHWLQFRNCNSALRMDFSMTVR